MGHRVPATAVVAVATLLAAVPVAHAQTRQQPAQHVGLILQGAHLGSALLSVSHSTVVQPVFSPLDHSANYLGVEITRVGDKDFAYYDVLLASGDQIFGETQQGSVSGGFGFPSAGRPGPRSGIPVQLSRGSYVFTLLTTGATSIGFTGLGSTRSPVTLVANHHSDTLVVGTELTGPHAGEPYQQLPLVLPPTMRALVSVAESQWSGTDTLDYTNSCLDQAPVPIPCNVDPIRISFAVNPVVDPGTHRSLESDTYSGDIPTGKSVLRYYSVVSGTMQHRSLLAFALA